MIEDTKTRDGLYFGRVKTVTSYSANNKYEKTSYVGKTNTYTFNGDLMPSSSTEYNEEFGNIVFEHTTIEYYDHKYTRRYFDESHTRILKEIFIHKNNEEPGDEDFLHFHISVTIYDYDKNNLLIEKKIFFIDEYDEYDYQNYSDFMSKYEDNDNLKGSNILSVSTFRYEYIEKLLISETFHSEQMQNKHKCIYEYDNKNNVTKMSKYEYIRQYIYGKGFVFTDNKTLVEVTTYEYDSNSNLIKKTVESGINDKGFPSSFSFEEYGNFDENGNPQYLSRNIYNTKYYHTLQYTYWK